MYVCEDASTGAAVWTATGSGGGGGMTWAKITGNTTAVVLNALQIAAMTTAIITANSTGVKIGALYISANSTR